MLLDCSCHLFVIIYLFNKIPANLRIKWLPLFLRNYQSSQIERQFTENIYNLVFIFSWYRINAISCCL